MDIETVKQANRIEEVIAEGLTLTGTGRYRKTREHDSLVVDVEGQSYFWNSQGEQGDVVDWIQKRRGWEFKEAVEFLCRRGHLEPPAWTKEDAVRAVERRAAEEALTVAARYFVHKLRSCPPALEYAQGRGWTEETIREAGLGFCDGDVQGLANELRMHQVDVHSPAARAALAFPGGMLVYPHVRQRRVMYLSGRSIEGKRHYNLAREFVGERQPFFNQAYSPAAERVVVVEGQADAVTWGQWGVAAVALAGVTMDVDLARGLAGHGQVYLDLDADAGGEQGRARAAELLGPMVRILAPWGEPGDGIKDANAALCMRGLDAEAAGRRLDKAEVWVMLQARAAGGANEAKREAALREVFGLVRRLDEFQVATLRGELAHSMGLGLREFNGLLKAAEQADEKATQDNGSGLGMVSIGGYEQDHLFECLYSPEESKTSYAVRYPDGRMGVVDGLVLKGVEYTPISPLHPALRKSVLLPDGIGAYDSVKALQREVAAFIHRYLDVDQFYEDMAAYYVLFTWMYDAFQVLPYLRALGDYGTGKTRFLLVIGSICYRPIFVAGATTTSPIFRMLNQFKGTLVLDEADFAASDAAVDIVKILNVGYARDFDVQRSAKTNDGQFEVEFFEVFGPKVIATRKKWQDRALESRCLTKEMGGTIVRFDVPVLLPLSFRDEARKLRNKLLRYRLDYWQPAIEVGDEDVDRGIEPRLNQVTMSLKKMVTDPELRAEIDRFIREYQRQATVDRGMTLAAKVLQAIVEVHASPTDVDETKDPPELVYDLSVASITERVNKILDEENEQEEDGQDGKGDKRPKLTPRKVGAIMRDDLQLRTQRETDGARKGRYALIWDEDRIKALCARMGLDLE